MNKHTDKGKIIIADDMEAIRYVFSDIADELGYQSLEAENGEEILQILGSNNDIRMIFTDVDMPLMTGIEAASEIRNNMGISSDEIPIFAITSHTDVTVENQCLDNGINRVIAKPIVVDQIIKTIKQFDTRM